MGYVLKVAYKHDVAMRALRTDDEIAAFLEELMAAGWEYTAATVYAVPEGSDAKPDHEMTVGADAESGLGAVRWTGDGTFYSQGEHANPNGVEHAYFGTAHDFPADSEVPLTTVRLAMRQLLDSHGRRPDGLGMAGSGVNGRLPGVPGRRPVREMAQAVTRSTLAPSLRRFSTKPG